jgi:hypothetical protein
MAITHAPPWLKKLSKSTVLVDDAEVQAEVARLKLRAEQDEKREQGGMFSGPMLPTETPAPPSLPFPELQPPPMRGDRFNQPVLPPIDEPVPPPSPLASPVPSAGPLMEEPAINAPNAPMPMPAFIAPPGAPPPPPPADRPPGSFALPPEKTP